MNAVTIVILAGILGGLCWFLVPFALRQRAERRLAALCKAKRAIVLTYDDGPGATLTPQLLDLLSESGVHATFFVLGQNAKAAPDLVRRLVQEGHEVGSHTYDHTNAWKVSPIRAARDVDAGVATVAKLGGDRNLFRPPYGKLTLAGLIAGLRRGFRYGWWTLDSRDSWDRRPMAEVLADLKAQGGGVVLMHDLDEYKDTTGDLSHIDYVLQLTTKLIALAKSDGYQVMRLGDLDAKAGKA